MAITHKEAWFTTTQCNNRRLENTAVGPVHHAHGVCHHVPRLIDRRARSQPVMHLLSRICARHHGPNTKVEQMCIAGLSTPCLCREEIKAGIRIIRGAGRVTILTGLVNNPKFIHVMRAWGRRAVLILFAALLGNGLIDVLPCA